MSPADLEWKQLPAIDLACRKRHHFANMMMIIIIVVVIFSFSSYIIVDVVMYIFINSHLFNSFQLLIGVSEFISIIN